MRRRGPGVRRLIENVSSRSEYVERHPFHFTICFQGWDGRAAARRSGKSPTVADEDVTRTSSVLTSIYDRPVEDLLARKLQHPVGSRFTGERSPRHGNYTINLGRIRLSNEARLQQ